MREYELMTIIKPNLDAEEVEVPDLGDINETEHDYKKIIEDSLGNSTLQYILQKKQFNI